MEVLVLVAGVGLIAFIGTRERVSEALTSTGLPHEAAHVLAASVMGALAALLAYGLLGRPD